MPESHPKTGRPRLIIEWRDGTDTSRSGREPREGWWFILEHEGRTDREWCRSYANAIVRGGDALGRALRGRAET